MGKTALDAFTKRMLAKRERQTDEMIRELKTEFSKPAPTGVTRDAMGAFDHLADLGEGRVSVVPGWERQYEKQNWDEETRKVRTPENDWEAVEFLRAVGQNDQAMIREINDRRHNQENVRADLATGIAAAGTAGGLVPTGFAAAIELIIVETARLRQLVNIIPGSQFAKKVPVQTTKTVAEIHTEGSDMNITVDPIYGSVTPEPVKIGGLVKISRENLDDSPLQTVSAVTRDLGEAIGTLEDLSILDGATFTDSLFADLSASADTWVDASETFATIVSKYYELGSVFRRRGTWLINATSAETITGLGIGTDGRPTMQEFNAAPMGQDKFGTLLGSRLVVFDSGVPVNEAVYGDLSGYSLYVRDALRAETSQDSDFATDQIAIRVSRRVDGILTQSARMLRFPAS